jgi:hypothetical protein
VQKFKWVIMIAVLTMVLASGAFVEMHARAASGEDTLYPGQTLTSGQNLLSQSGSYTLAMQSDGNLVEYDSSGRPLWASGTSNNPGTILIDQSDGNMVLVAPGNTPIWSTNTSGHTGTALTIQNDANIVAYAPGQIAIWASGSGTTSNTKVEAAIKWFMDRIGSTSWEGLCEKSVENAYGTTARYRSARANWNDRIRLGQALYPYSAAPRGALVYYNTSSNGHVSISLGDGRVVSTSVKGRIGIASISFFQNPLGWAYEPW